MYEVWLLKIDKWSLDIDNYYYLACYPNIQPKGEGHIFLKKMYFIYNKIYMLCRYAKICANTLFNSKVY